MEWSGDSGPGAGGRPGLKETERGERGPGTSHAPPVPHTASPSTSQAHGAASEADFLLQHHTSPYRQPCLVPL